MLPDPALSDRKLAEYCVGEIREAFPTAVEDPNGDGHSTQTPLSLGYDLLVEPMSALYLID